MSYWPNTNTLGRYKYPNIIDGSSFGKLGASETRETIMNDKGELFLASWVAMSIINSNGVELMATKEEVKLLKRSSIGP